jgi:urease accessory protein
LIHPLSGIDHLVAMIALGVWAAVIGGRGLWLLPMTFLSAMALAGFFGQMNMSLPLTEEVILASALLLSAFAVLRVRFDHKIAVALAIVFAIAHGYAHGTELPAQVSFLLYGIGFITATAVLHMSGILIAHLTSRTEVRAPRTTS